jgi:hypothetical protein
MHLASKLSPARLAPCGSTTTTPSHPRLRGCHPVAAFVVRCFRTKLLHRFGKGKAPGKERGGRASGSRKREINQLAVMTHRPSVSVTAAQRLTCAATTTEAAACVSEEHEQQLPFKTPQQRLPKLLAVVVALLYVHDRAVLLFDQESPCYCNTNKTNNLLICCGSRSKGGSRRFPGIVVRHGLLHCKGGSGL